MQKVFRRIRPSSEEVEKIRRVSGELLSRINKEASIIDGRLKAAILGSVSRGTWLKDEKDIDVFIFFPLEYPKEDLERVVTRLGEKVLERPEKHYAEHPYVMGSYRGYEVEIIPCYAVESPSKLKSAVDRTPFHDAFVRERIVGKEDEVRLLKRFLKGISCYGAEAKVEGFSGYLTELLVLKYGSFEEVLKAARGWKHREVISLGAVEDRDKLREMFKSPLIFIDPVDPRRNVASALSEKNFAIFRYAAREYLRDPRMEFFFPRQRRASKEQLQKLFKLRGTNLVALFFSKPEVLEDIIYTQGRKTVRTIAKVLERGDFRVLRSDFYVRERICIIFEVESNVIPTLKLHLGPKNNLYHENRFLRKYREYKDKITEPFLLNGRWAIYLKRKHTEADVYLRDFLSAGSLKKKGIPSHFARMIEEGFQIKTDEDVFQEEFLRDILEFLDPRFPWEV